MKKIDIAQYFNMSKKQFCNITACEKWKLFRLCHYKDADYNKIPSLLVKITESR